MPSCRHCSPKMPSRASSTTRDSCCSSASPSAVCSQSCVNCERTPCTTRCPQYDSSMRHRKPSSLLRLLQRIAAHCATGVTFCCLTLALSVRCGRQFRQSGRFHRRRARRNKCIRPQFEAYVAARWCRPALFTGSGGSGRCADPVAAGFQAELQQRSPHGGRAPMVREAPGLPGPGLHSGPALPAVHC